MLSSVEELLRTSHRRRSHRDVARIERLASALAPLTAATDATAEVGIPVQTLTLSVAA